MTTQTDQTVETADPTAGIEGGPNGNGSGADATGPAAVAKPTVYQAIARVVREMPAVPKDRKGPEAQGSYRYRGIEDVLGAAQKLLGREGVVIAPHAQLLNLECAAKSGYVNWVVEFTWTVTGPAGDRMDPAPTTIGVGHDNTDKGVNKAQTQAYKYLLLALLQVNDSATPEPDAQGDYGAAEREAQLAATPHLDADTAAALIERVKALADGPKAKLVRAWTLEGPDGESYLPVHEGKPGIRLLRVTDLADAEALIAQAEKETADQASAARGRELADRAAAHATPAAAPEDPPEAPEPAAQPDTAAEVPALPNGNAAAPIVAGAIEAHCPDLARFDDLAAPGMEDMDPLRRRVAEAGKAVPNEFAVAVYGAVADIKNRANAVREVTAVPGQTVGTDPNEHIDRLRMRIALWRMLVEGDRLAQGGAQ